MISKKSITMMGTLVIAGSSLFVLPVTNYNASAKSETINFWYGGDGDKDIKPIIKSFTKKTGIKVTIQSIPWSQYNDKLLTAAASKSGPDVLVVGTTEMPNMVSSKTVMNISKYVKKDKSINPSNFFEGSVNTTKYSGKYYALPWYVETRVLYYRKDLLKKVGYKHAPKTWSQLYKAALKLSKRGSGMYGFNVDASEPTFGFMFARQNGATLIKNGKAQFDKKPMVSAINYLHKFVKNGASPKQDLKLTIGQSFGGNGKVPMFISGPWMMSSIESDSGLKDSQWGVAQLPSGKDGNTSNTGGGDIAVFNYTKKKAASIKLMKFLSTKTSQLEYYKNSDSMPTLKSAWTDKSLSNSKIQVFRKQLNNSEPMPLIKQWDEIGTNYLQAWQEIALKNSSVKKTMTSFTQQTNKLINK
ncbi:sugar ABC transporter substrate-binding protein [Oenococcus oeni]|uniref:ABC transporter substrate-binding protein n=1 Tax=Oenococcus oeni TaxID=1247 RepID=A0A6N3ZZ32_OENOE|nr:sugar ABC transporter substrate-binding protein [Oenococcus oeni]MDV7715696.1 extracellular solute-binding protein [Oenococcus oeni]OIK56061.1 ABC transporter substrate-binding protein [Oenococcus oeni]OIK85344.1 ABC transporter substrate-binding protein [Oenococcus oeni]OIL07700.1 ABC transporter substrate-binding protein [Oenococcus oeni]OIL11334.1 ABC transporter substrate-binding protein [Oenococcus oeni]